MVLTRAPSKAPATEGPVGGRSDRARPPVSGWLVYVAFDVSLLGLYAIVPGGDKAVVVVCIVASLTILPLALHLLRTRDREARHRVGTLANRLTGLQDRKSTRLNSSHGYISYAVFCL